MILTFANIVIIYSTFPETANLTLEEIGRLFGDVVIREEEAGRVVETMVVSNQIEKDEKDEKTAVSVGVISV